MMGGTTHKTTENGLLSRNNFWSDSAFFLEMKKPGSLVLFRRLCHDRAEKYDLGKKGKGFFLEKCSPASASKGFSFEIS